jgi:hypothetical protein
MSMQALDGYTLIGLEFVILAISEVIKLYVIFFLRVLFFDINLFGVFRISFKSLFNF